MRRARLVFVATSVGISLLFAGLLMASRAGQEELFRSLGILAEVVHLVHEEYVDSLDTEALKLSLEAGIVQSVDPWAAVLPGAEVEAYQEMLQAPPPYGLGLAGRFSSAAVRHTIPGSPAEEAGLVVWEVIELVEGVNTRGRPLWQIRLELSKRERQKLPLHLTVVGRFGDERREVVLEASEWQPRPVSSEEHDDGVQVLRVDDLPRHSAARVAEALSGHQQIIIDLRQLVWGLEEEAIKVADLFAPDGLVLGQWRGQRAGEETFRAATPALAEQPPLVLIGPNTEGVGEILAAALQRAGATLIGHRTIGHAPHMDLVHDGDLYLWIPVARWLRADEQPIYGIGVEPDETVELAEAEEDDDQVLRRALELMRERHGHKAAA